MRGVKNRHRIFNCLFIDSEGTIIGKGVVLEQESSPEDVDNLISNIREHLRSHDTVN